ncbi:MAG TPA: NUDIX hydrolase [Desulfobulbus sp.]|nr:NUDIX hydrolase [Desulfobulbus sp.]HHD64207.1 NUDIX hydrolase [Desulfobulbaceae bacterium]
MAINKFCSICGAVTERIVPEGDERYRAVCTSCHTIHYENPKLVVGCLVTRNESILLCRRAIEPQKGKWTLPAGYLENHETAVQGALRETTEESGAEVSIPTPYRLFDLPHISQLYLLFRAQLLACPFRPTRESLEVRLFHPKNIPWDALAFRVIAKTLEQYVHDAAKGEFSFEHHVISRN